MITKLDIVNACLLAINNSMVPDLTQMDIDTEAASTFCDEAHGEILSKGWWFNKEDGWALTPNAYDGTVEMPKTIISFYATGYNLRSSQLVVRGRFLYDLIRHTKDMSAVVNNDGKIVIDAITYVDLEDCPYTAQKAILEMAKMKMLKSLDGSDPNKIRGQESEVTQATVMLEREHIRISKENGNTSAMVAAFTTAVGGATSYLGTPIRNPLGGSDR